jgi:hypothetical protein
MMANKKVILEMPKVLESLGHGILEYRSDGFVLLLRVAGHALKV